MSILSLFETAHDDRPRIERVRHEPKTRSVRVEKSLRLTPGMLRITFSGDDLADFESLGFDDHVKLFVPGARGTIERRDYTPRRFDASSRLLVLDFAMHEAGPATRWALAAKPGDVIEIAGPKKSAIFSPPVQQWLLIGDETALPAIGRNIEEASGKTRIVSTVAVAERSEEHTFDTKADLTMLWAHRPLTAAADPTALLSVLQSVSLSPGTFVWIAAEASVARAIRNHIVDDRRYPRNWVKAGGYWVQGRADAHERIG